MEKTVNEFGREVWSGVTLESDFHSSMFSMLPARDQYDDDVQMTLHSNIGSITVLDRMTGFGWRDVETGWRCKETGKFWLASGNFDIRTEGCKTFGEAIEAIKRNANNCVGV